MKVNYSELMKKLGVGRELNVYETQPWLTYDEATNMTCEAEVRCNHDKTEIEAEMQLMPDTPMDGKPPVEIICLIRADKYKQTTNDYTITSCVIKGKEYKNEFYDWETKSCNFFRALVTAIRNDKIPDVDKILAKEMKANERYGGNGGDGSNKAPKINASQLMYDRKGGMGAGF